MSDLRATYGADLGDVSSLSSGRGASSAAKDELLQVQFSKAGNGVVDQALARELIADDADTLGTQGARLAPNTSLGMTLSPTDSASPQMQMQGREAVGKPCSDSAIACEDAAPAPTDHASLLHSDADPSCLAGLDCTLERTRSGT